MIIVTPQDFRRLSKACQLELISMIGFSDDNTEYLGNVLSSFSDDEEVIDDIYKQKPKHPTSNDIVGDKQVIDITNEHAQSLIANISNKSLETLKLFAQGEPVDLNEIVGTDKLYENFNDLKRSFVGAVNRRLRTVTGNRQAVLFASLKSKPGVEEPRIRVKPRTAAALRTALNVNEPLPEFEFYNSDGCLLLKSDETTKDKQDRLQHKLSSTWQEFVEHPADTLTSVTSRQIAEHYVKHGFLVKMGSAVSWDNLNCKYEYTFSEPISSLDALYTKLYHLGYEDTYTQIAIIHPKVTDLLALIK